MSDPWIRTVARAADAVARVDAGEATVLMGGTAVFLNETAAQVWERADGTRTLAQIAAALGEVYDVDAAVLRAELTAFVEQAAAAGWLVLADAPAPAR